MEKGEIAKVATAVNRWLSYQILCGREPLLCEGYLGHPIAEYLIHKHSGRLETEFTHPVLKSPKSGRPYQIDYVLLSKNKKEIEIVIECKWITNKAYNRQRILDDILRLECVHIPGRHVKRFLLVAAHKGDFQKRFADLTKNMGPGKPRKDFTRRFLRFSKTTPERTVKPYLAKKPFKSHYKDFSDSFNKSPVPKTFKTKLVARRWGDNISVYIWEIMSVGNRSTFNP